MIAHSTTKDILDVLKIYEEASLFQQFKSGKCWSIFSEASILNEIISGQHFKLQSDKKQILGIFSAIKSAPLLWNDTKGKEAIYLHRIAISNLYRGKNGTQQIIDWAMVEAWKHKRKYIRIDTWADNEPLTNYFQKMGFELIHKKQLPKKSKLPNHYNDSKINLLEIKL